jgi:hypothetical protein
MRPGLHLVVADAPPSRACNARVWLNPGSRGLVKRATLDTAARADVRLAERHALLCHAETFESLVVMRLSPDWEMAVRRADGDGGERVVMRDVGDAAIVRPGDRVVRRPPSDPPRRLFLFFRPSAPAVPPQTRASLLLPRPSLPTARRSSSPRSRTTPRARRGRTSTDTSTTTGRRSRATSSSRRGRIRRRFRRYR